MVEQKKQNTRELVEGLISENKINPDNFKEISENLNIPYKTLKWYYYKLRNKPTNNLKPVVKIIPRIKINFSEENGSLYLNIKTCEDFENHLKENKEIRESENYFNTGGEGLFYVNALNLDSRRVDSINRELFYNNKLNYAILRIPGISKGLKFEVEGLYSESTIIKEVRALVKNFMSYYKREIEKIPLNISGEVVSEITEVQKNE